MKKKFYTYAHYKADTKEVFYIGKGTGQRRFQKTNRNTHWHNTVKKHGYTIELLAEFDVEQEALDHEVFLIWCFRDMGYKLVNKTDGGEGTSGMKHTDEAKAKMSAVHKGKPRLDLRGKKLSDEQKAKLSLALKGRIVSEETRKKLSDNNKRLGMVRFITPGSDPIYRFIGTSIADGTQIVLVGGLQIKEAGFCPSHINKCCSGKSKYHKGYTFKKELL
jgi:hypothetical protein